MDMTNLHRSPPMNQSETDLGIVNESQLLRFGISHHGCAEITRHSRTRMVLTVSFVLSPVIGLSCHRHP
jgi:hypothetical protein